MIFKLIETMAILFLLQTFKIEILIFCNLATVTTQSKPLKLNPVAHWLQEVALIQVEHLAAQGWHFLLASW